MSRRLMGFALAILLFTSGCSGEETPAAGEDATNLTVAAASDLQAAFTEIGARFEQETGYSVTFSFGSTGNLATQIENGAPFDVFAAANEAFVDDLIDKGVVDAQSKQLYGVGSIVLASNAEAGVDVRSLDDLLSPDIRHVAIANPEHAPYGIAAREALISAGLWDALQPKLVYGENIRQALQFVQTGNAEAGIVALSIADVPEIHWTMIDESLHASLLQAMAMVSDTAQLEAAREFIEFVTGPEGRAILESYGFSPPDQSR